MPTHRIHDTAGEMTLEEPIVLDAGVADLVELEPQVDLESKPEPEQPASAAELGFSGEQKNAIERLRALGSTRVRLRNQLEDVERELLGDAIVQAFRAGIPKLVISREAAVTRQTVYNVIERAVT